MPRVRGTGKRVLKPLLHIFCEGEKTEPNYLKGYLAKYHPGNRTLKVIRIAETVKNTPEQLVDVAMEKKNSHDASTNDEYWVVYDREAISKYSDSLHLKSLSKANANTINVALSNVCFEVWILLHLITSVGSFNSCNDLLKRSPLKAKFKQKGIEYDKGNPSIFEIISDNIPKARDNAKKMNKRTLESSEAGKDHPFQLNPYTDVYKLLDAIDIFVDK